MSYRKFVFGTVVAAGALCLGAVASPATAFHDGGLVELNSHSFTWVEPATGGTVLVTETVFEGCEGVDPSGAPFFIPHDMTFQYTVDNVSFDPVPGITNGFSGFQLRFPQAVPELYNQQSPAVGGPWAQNAFSGLFPPFGTEWDVNLPDMGIMPGQSGVFSFCTFERADVVVDAPDAGWFHTWGLPVPEPIIDADGITTADAGLPGAVTVAIGDPLASFPVTGPTTAGLDWFDNDHDGQWTSGDDLHSEDPATCSTAIRDGDHDLGLDCKILDLDNSLINQQPVDCDLEVNVAFTEPHVSNGGCPSSLNNIRWHDADGDSSWDNGEDIVLDANGDMFFGEVANIQTYITYETNSVPGELMFALDLDACSDDHQICKKVKYLDDDRDGVIEVGEPVEFLEVIQVHNSSPDPWMDVVVTDRWGAEIDVLAATPSHGTVELTTKGASEKEFLSWDVGVLAPGDTANLVLTTATDLDPGGYQEYTEAGEYEYNSGAVLKFKVQPFGAKKPHQESFDTGSVMLIVMP